MRVQPLLFPILALSFGFTLAACAGAGDPPRVTTGLRCDAGGGQTQQCTLVLTAPAGYTITLTTNSCDAINDEIELTSPVAVVLTTDACREPNGRLWDYSTPIDTGRHRDRHPVQLGPVREPARRAASPGRTPPGQ